MLITSYDKLNVIERKNDVNEHQSQSCFDSDRKTMYKQTQTKSLCEMFPVKFNLTITFAYKFEYFIPNF